MVVFLPIATTAAVHPAVANPVSSPGLVNYKSKSSSVTFLVPEGWVTVYDRNADQSGAPFLLVGNFKSFDTMSVAKSVLPSMSADGSGKDFQLQQVSSSLLQEMRDAPSTLELEVLRTDAKGDGGVEVEYVHTSCRGEQVEGLGGRISCVGPRGAQLQVIVRHGVIRCIPTGDTAYVLKASTPGDRWSVMQSLLRSAIDSFQFATS